MSGDAIQRLGRALRSDDNRLDGLNALGKIDTIDETVAENLIDDIEYALGIESNAYTLLQLLRELQRIADQHPQIAATATSTIVKLTNGSIAKYEGDNPSESQKIGRCVEIIETILENTDPREQPLELHYRDVRDFVQKGEGTHRALAYRLMGRTATGEGVRVLLRDFSHELQPVKSARETAIREASTLVSDTLEASDYLPRTETIDSFSELYAAEYLTPTAEQLNTVQTIVFELVGEGEGEEEQLASAVARITRHDSEFARSLINEVVERLGTNPSQADEMWWLLRPCAEGAPEIVAEHAQVLAGELEGASRENQRYGLEVIYNLAERQSSVPAAFADPVLNLIEHSDREIVERALNTAGIMGFYPEPDQVAGLTTHNSSAVSAAAQRAIDNIRKKDSVHSHTNALRKTKTEIGLFGDGDGDIFLKRRTQTGKWVSVRLGEFREKIVKGVIERFARGENVPVVYPYYEPRDIVPLVIALTLEHANEDVQIGLHSPGSQTQWGMKGELREELGCYGLSDVPGEVISATPIPEVVPDAYISGGKMKDNSDGQGPGRIVISKDIPELESAPSLDLIVINATARSRIDDNGDLDSLEAAHSSANIVTAYSCYTRNDTEGRPRYGPPNGLESSSTIPDVDLVDSVIGAEVDDPESGSQNQLFVSNHSFDGETVSTVEPWRIGNDDVRAFSEEHEIEVEHIETERLSALFDQVFEESAKLRDVEDEGASSLIFSRQMFFERLPVPAKDYDEWIRDRLYDGDRYVPPLIQERIEDLDHKARSVERLEGVQPLNTSIKIFERIDDSLREDNPMFEALKRHIADARAEEQTLAIFSESPKNAQLLREVLSKYGLLEIGEDVSDIVRVVAPNDARNIGPHDTLLILGALHPENAGFYVHPRSRKTVVLTYDRSWATMIERHASKFVELLNGAIGSPDYTPFANPELVGDLPIVEEEEASENPTDSDSPKFDSPDGERTKAQILEEALRSVSGTTHREDSGRYERELRHFAVETDSDEKHQFTNHDTILRRRETSTGNDLQWVNPETLSKGDTIVTIPKEIQQDLWRRQLVELYEEELGSHQAIEDIELWHEALNSIWNRTHDELGRDRGYSDGEMYQTLYDWIDREVDEFDRTSQTVRKWFESVRNAESPMDLAEDPSLILGPRSYHDIRAIGEAFGHQTLTTRAEEIEGSMQAIRTINQHEGHDYRDKLRKEITGGQSEVAQAATFHRVTDIREGKLETTAESGGGNDNDIIEERVRELIEMAPTKNSELAEAWGYESGSELYQFLSTEFDEYYERNKDKLIVPTQQAKNLVDE